MNNDYSLSAKKSLGQNFLKSKKAIYQMIDSAQTNATDTIIEIGPGKGALTRPILETGARVIAFELDSRMIDFLQIELSEYIDSGKLEIIHQDVLDIDMDSFLTLHGALDKLIEQNIGQFYTLKRKIVLYLFVFYNIIICRLEIA